MRLLIQRVHQASVTVDNTVVSSIGLGLLVLVGFGQVDTENLPQSHIWSGMVDKMLHARIFPGIEPDKIHKFDRDVLEMEGEVLLVSQFTLYADCRKGRRPGFQNATAPDVASRLFQRLVDDVDARLPHRVRSGIFGAHMDVALTNWGPVTMMLDSQELFPAAQ